MNIHSTRRRAQAGFSLIELMVCMSVMLVISATIFSLMGNSLKVGATASERTNISIAI
jgi:prepilin-type N-terminal cleavage/methylation domain-containing protein